MEGSNLGKARQKRYRQNNSHYDHDDDNVLGFHDNSLLVSAGSSRHQWIMTPC